jgi:hypothetical protein
MILLQLFLFRGLVDITIYNMNMNIKCAYCGVRILVWLKIADFWLLFFVGDPHRNRHNMNLAENKPLPVPQFLKFNWQRFLSQITGKLLIPRKLIDRFLLNQFIDII